MTSEVASRDQKRILHPAVDVSKEVITTPSLKGSIINLEAYPGSSEETLRIREGGLTAWLVVLSCFLLNFNILGINYAYGRRNCLHINPLHDTNYIGVYQAHYLLHQFPNQSAEVLCFLCPLII